MRKAMLIVTAAMLLLVSAPARPDTESPYLARYRAPVDQAVQKALAFLAKRLASDASFASEVKNLNAVSGLAGMAFLSVGHTPGRGPYGDVVNRCIDFI
ncbi:MAG: prenyltransferase, partial [Planctomycetes bacterium]|nr:prenyltransferase [Planctomycetota bacterium]